MYNCSVFLHSICVCLWVVYSYKYVGYLLKTYHSHIGHAGHHVTADVFSECYYFYLILYYNNFCCTPYLQRLVDKIIIFMSENTFELIKKVDNNGRGYWSSRELARALEYTDYRNFLTAVNKAKTACENSGEIIHNHFVDANEMVMIGSGAF